MQINLKCKINLSKKLRNILRNGGSIVLTSDSITSGKGEGVLTLTDNTNNPINTDELIGKETSIMLTPTNADQNPNNSVTNIFSRTEQPQQRVGSISSGQNQRDAVDRLAATTPPKQNNRAYYSQDELEVPQEFEKTQNIGFATYVKDLQELVTAVKGSKDKNSNINVEEVHEHDSMEVRKQKALRLEQKDMAESIGRDAYVVNETCASLTVNDIDLVLPLNMPRNLGTVSAKKLASSRELWGLFRQKMIRLVSPNEANHFIKNAGTMDKTYVPELEIYDSRYDAQDEIYDDATGNGRVGEVANSNAEILNLDMSDLEGESEEMQNFRVASANRQTRNGNISTLSGGTRRSFHGSGSLAAEEESLDRMFSGNEFEIDGRTVGKNSKINQAGVKTVASRHSRRR